MAWPIKIFLKGQKETTNFFFLKARGKKKKKKNKL